MRAHAVGPDRADQRRAAHTTSPDREWPPVSCVVDQGSDDRVRHARWSIASMYRGLREDGTSARDEAGSPPDEAQTRARHGPMCSAALRHFST